MMGAEPLNSERLVNNCDSVTNRKNRIGLISLSVFGTFSVGISLVSFSFIVPALRKICLPYVPATDQQITNVLKLLKRGGKVLDLGSGDGRIVLAAAKAGFEADGVDLNPWLIYYSRYKSFWQGLHKSTRFYRRDLWETDLRKYQNIIIFGVEEMMPLLEDKAKVELCQEGRIIACRFQLPTWKLLAKEGAGIDSAWMYGRP